MHTSPTIAEIAAEPAPPSVSRFAIPPGRDPFVNTPLLALGKDAEGRERFWISSYNSNCGCQGIVVTESGRERIYPFDASHRGFYGAAQEDDDTLWLCGDLSKIVRLTLSTGAYESYDTGAPSALVFQGLRFDSDTGKLFVAAYVQGKRTIGVSFDCWNRRPARLYESDCPSRYTRVSFPNGDGSHTILVVVPTLSLLRWEPRKETVEVFSLPDSANFSAEKHGSLFYGGLRRLISDENGRRYFPGLGWYDPATRGVTTDGPIPKREATWFSRKGHFAWGLSDASINDPTSKVLMRWNLATGEVHSLAAIPDTDHSGACLTEGGKIVAFSIYGDFLRFDAHTGALEISKQLPTDSVARVDCLVRIDRRRLLGTPFITQRFWEIDLATGRGYDCGRGAPGSGQIAKVWKMGDHVYMAAYAGGELVKYDPSRHPHFSENPRVVADPPDGMRPVAATQGDRFLYYSCSLNYGQTGSILTRYDTITGEASYKRSPIADQMICSLQFDRERNTLLAGTTMHADSQSCDPASRLCHLAILNADDLSLLQQASAPEGSETVAVLGAMGEGTYLCSCSQRKGGPRRWFEASVRCLAIPGFMEMSEFPDGFEDILWTRKPGIFVLRIARRYELWDMRKPQLLRPLYDGGPSDVYGLHVQDNSVYFVTPAEIIILEDCLDDLAV